MSEEEIIKILNYQLKMKDSDVYTPINYDAIQGLLDLYIKQQKEIEKLKEKLNGERDFTKATLETLKECIHKEDLRRLFQSYMKRLNEELLTYDENDIENRTACQYCKSKLRFLLADIYKLLGY